MLFIVSAHRIKTPVIMITRNKLMAQRALLDLFVVVLAGIWVTKPTTATIPHVSECRLCQYCHLTEVPPTGRRLSGSAVEVTGASTVGATADESKVAGRGLAQATVGASTSASLNSGNVTGASGTGSNGKAGDQGGGQARGRGSGKGRKKQRIPKYDPELDPNVPIQFKPSSYKPRPLSEMVNLPVCNECYGCLHNLTLISESTTFMNTTYSMEMGATSSWLFKSNTNMTPSGEAAVKVYCLPVAKRPGGQVPGCNPARIAEVMRQLIAIDKLSVECGFTDLVPRMWLAPVRGVVPGVGYPVNWWGLWMEFVEGVSLESFLYRGYPRRLPMDFIAEFINVRLNKTRVVRSALFDLLTSQCDRHAQNIFVQEDGNIRLIDNESCLQHMWLFCGFDSIFVPTTQKQEIVRLSNHYVLKLPSRTGDATLPRPDADPQLILDYRCYLPDGRKALGTTYPPEVDTCLRRIAGMTPEEVRDHYGFPELRVAENLHTRAVDMITRGYEWAAKYGKPQNAQPRRYRFQEPCCQLAINRSLFQCGHPWVRSAELPLGNPVTGRAWDKDRPDPGKYTGGTFPEDEEAGAEAGPGGGAAAAR